MWAGAPSRIRTGDLLITNQLLYRCSYRGVLFALGRVAHPCPALPVLSGPSEIKRFKMKKQVEPVTGIGPA